MTSIQITLIIALIFSVFALCAALYINALNQKKQKRAALILGNRASKSQNVGHKLFGDSGRRSDMSKKLKSEKEEAKEEDNTKSIRHLLLQAGFLDAPVAKFWLFSACFCLVASLVSKFILGVGNILLITLVITYFFGIPRLFLKFLIKRRQKKFLQDFADALESMMRLLKAGMPVGEAIAMVSREFDGPVGEEMQRIYDEQKIGIPLSEAVLAGAKRMPIPEMQMFATGISIQQQTGSSLSEILQNLATVIRARFRLKRKVQALSSEAKASAGIIASLPVFVASVLFYVAPDYVDLLLNTSTGKTLVYISLGMMLTGVLIMRQMINFKV